MHINIHFDTPSFLKSFLLKHDEEAYPQKYHSILGSNARKSSVFCGRFVGS